MRRPRNGAFGGSAPSSGPPEGAAALLAVDREIGRRRRRSGQEGQEKPRERKLKRRRGGEDGHADQTKKGRAARVEAAEAPPAAAAASGVLPASGRSSASQALQNPHLPTVTKRRYALQQERIELEEIAGKLRRHGRRRQGASSSRAVGQEQPRAGRQGTGRCQRELLRNQSEEEKKRYEEMEERRKQGGTEADGARKHQEDGSNPQSATGEERIRRALAMIGSGKSSAEELK
jgi:hypothetical protein